MGLEGLIGPAFSGIHEDIGRGGHTHYWLGGGRGSGKSSYISLEMVWGIMRDPLANGVIIRKVGRTLRQSVYEQVLWACDTLGCGEQWQGGVSPLEVEYEGLGQRLVFRGADEPRKLKSLKFRHGYCKFLWFEELEEFGGLEEIRSITQSLIRGGERFVVFYSYNPPRSRGNWINRHIDLLQSRAGDAFVHHSTYEDIPEHWLGEQFVMEARHLRDTQPQAYAHEYLGEVVGEGGEIFRNIELLRIEDEQILGFDRVLEGVDWGYASDPFAWVRLYYDRARRVLYIYDEIFATGLSNRAAAGLILERGNRVVIAADNAEPKSIAEFNELGVRTRKAVKGPGSLGYGMKFLASEVERIVIDPARCPNAAREFCEYSHLNSEASISLYPDKNNHTIDAVRYALEPYMGGGNNRKGILRVKGV